MARAAHVHCVRSAAPRGARVHRSATARSARGWRTPSPAASTCYRCVGSRATGFEVWAEVIAHDYEGLVAKEEASEAGPTRRWLKVKQRGWTIAEDRWQRRISAFLT